MTGPLRLAPVAPNWVRTRLVTQPPPAVQAGAVLDYRLGAAGVTVPCRIFVREYDPPVRFVAVQLRGPYGKWEHRLILIEQDGGTLAEDLVRYQLRWGPLGRAAHAALVRRLIERAWRHRYAALAGRGVGRGSRP